MIYSLAIVLIFFDFAKTQDIIRRIDVSKSRIIDSDKIEDIGGIVPGILFNPSMVEAANKKIISELHQEGYLFARIDSVSIVRPDTNHIDLTWHIYDGNPVIIHQVTLTADSLDFDKVREQLDINEGDIYNQNVIETELARINQYYAENGYPFAEVIISDARLSPAEDEYLVDLDLEVVSGKKVNIEGFRLSGNTVTKDKVILRELDLQIGDIYDQEKINLIPEKLNRLGFFTNVAQPQLTLMSDGRTALMIEIEEGNSTTFDGIIGYIPPSQNVGGQDGYFTGLINLRFRNLFGTGRRFEVDWKKQDRYSDEFRLYYEEPWIFGFPLNLGGGLYRLVRDTTYIERTYSFNGLLRINSDFHGTFGLIHNSYIPDSLASRESGLAENTILSGELGLVYDTRDFPINPRKGLFYDTFISFGFKENLGPEYLFQEYGLAKSEEIQRIRISLAYFQKLWQNQVLAFRIFGGRVDGSENQLQLTDHFWFGGARTLRGYREDQFHGTTISWVNLEYRFLTGRESRVYVFNDWGFYHYMQDEEKYEDILLGYGIGLRFMTPLGIMSVDFALGREDTFSTAKIHFGIVNNF